MIYIYLREIDAMTDAITHAAVVLLLAVALHLK
jgi:hypothetical protein